MMETQLEGAIGHWPVRVILPCAAMSHKHFIANGTKL
jgi:hypothetical protein